MSVFTFQEMQKGAIMSIEPLYYRIEVALHKKTFRNNKDKANFLRSKFQKLKNVNQKQLIERIQSTKCALKRADTILEITRIYANPFKKYKIKKRKSKKNVIQKKNRGEKRKNADSKPQIKKKQLRSFQGSDVEKQNMQSLETIVQEKENEIFLLTQDLQKYKSRSYSLTSKLAIRENRIKQFEKDQLKKDAQIQKLKVNKIFRHYIPVK